ncbi:MAG TPA: DUF6317 family protein [Pseudonocardiaceae bacterium]|nr:DUF6317 family protein [Pseudonocardiaceae bacterium]
MSAGYQVTLDELAAAAGKFGEEGQTLTGVAKGVPQSGPDTGDGGLNATLNAVLSATQLLGETLAGQVTAHAGKLHGAHDSYQRSDTNNQQLFTELMGK